MAVIAHADVPDLLRLCIAHHLSIGVDAVFVALNVDDAESAAVPGEFGAANVRAARLETFAGEGHPLDYFTGALHAAMSWFAADWVLFLDSDEFWVPAGGAIRSVAALAVSDAYSVRRFNVPPLRGADGAVRAVDVRDAMQLPLVGSRQAMDADWLAQHPDTPWIAAKILPKIMVRPEVAATIDIGAHGFVPCVAEPRVTIPVDLLIVHVPFTTVARFRRKVDLIRTMLTRYPDQFPGNLAWHWRRWVSLDDAGDSEAEFAAQVIDEADVPALISRGMLTTPSRLFAEGSLREA